LSRARLDATNLSNSRQELEEKMMAERLNHAVACQELQTDRAHLEVQLESIRARMKKTEEQLVRWLFINLLRWSFENA
jgi:hypothetical protein